jgi:spermidine synthase
MILPDTPPHLDGNEVNAAPRDYSHLLIDGWFHERNDELWPGQALSLEVKRVLYHERSKFQDILVFESTHYGTVLVLDGVIQATQRDEHR